MDVELMNHLEQDAEAVVAVRKGDAERYRELVERHERRVFAVAWSRLGDAALAEEATQEAFIRGYQRLSLLRDGAKFAGWIGSIARNAAINLGWRHRRELNKRERWALEQSDQPPSANESEDDPYTPETLRHTLAELPAGHRECLVQFYLEGKSSQEAAETLGISDAAFRVRLHRARDALRAKMEQKLSDSLSKLRPAKTIAPAIMVAVLSASTTKATAGIGTASAGVLAAVSPVKWIFTFFHLLVILPTFLFGWIITRLELLNFRDQQGFRAKLYRRGVLFRFLGIALLMVTILFLNRYVFFSYGIRKSYLFLSLCFSPWCYVMVRRAVINRNRYFLASVFSLLLVTIGALLVGFRLLPVETIHLFIALQMIITALSFGDRPARLDYNLFLRGAEGLLTPSASMASFGESNLNLNRREMLDFARFLGTQWLATNYHWRDERLELGMPSLVATETALMQRINFWSRGSRVYLFPDGSVIAEFSERDSQSLHKLRDEQTWSNLALEDQVGAAVKQAWMHFRKQDFVSARRALGDAPDAEIFVLAPSQTGLTRWYKRITIALAVICFSLCFVGYLRPPWANGLQPAEMTETEVRNLLLKLESLSVQTQAFKSSLLHFQYASHVLPPTNLFTAASFAVIRRHMLETSALSHNQSMERKIDVLAGSRPIAKELTAGWFHLKDFDVIPSDISSSLRARRFNPWTFLLTRRLCRSDEGEFHINQFDTFTLAQLRLLRDWDCMDLVKSQEIIKHIISLQVLSGDTAENRPPLKNWKDIRGLFFTPGWPVLQDTYFDLAALEILGGLDQIDREACIRALLRFHRGKGYFAATGVDEPWKLKIHGDAKDTFCAFESLRILGALDRVTDLSEWKFRTRKRAKENDDSPYISWEEIEAWVCQQRLERFLRVNAGSSGKTGPSLLDP